MKNKAVFIDRDGTLNVEKHYLYKLDDWEFIADSVPAIAGLHRLGYRVIVVTNQSGIARGYYQLDDVHRLHVAVNQLLRAAGTSIDAFYLCPHHPDVTGDCPCRKPKPGMLLAAARDLEIDLTQSFMIGDKLLDAQTGLRVGCTPILVRTGYGERGDTFGEQEVARIVYADNLYAAYQYIASLEAR